MMHSQRIANREYGRMIGVLLAGSLLSGCATVPQHGGFKTVAQNASQRTGAVVIWNQDSKDDQLIQTTIHKLLEKPLTADAAVQIALLNNPMLQAHYEALGVSQADVVQAGLLSNPVFTFDFRFPAAPSHGWDASVAQNFLDVLLMPARKKIAKAQFKSAKALVSSAVIKLAGCTRQAYYRAVGDQQLVNLEKTIQNAQAAQLDLAKKLRQAGNSAPLAYDQQLALYERIRLTWAMDKARQLEDHERLNEIMGLWGPQDQWTIPNRLPALAGKDIPLKGLESLAIARNLKLTAAWNQVQVAAVGVEISGLASLMPGATVGLDYVRDPDVRGTLGPAISVPIPIFNQGQPQIAITKALYRAAYRRYQAMAVRIRAQVRETWIAMHAYRRESLFYQHIMLPLRNRIVQQTQLAYNGMYVNAFVLLESKQSEIDCARHYVRALRHYWMTRQKLLQLLGGRLPAAGVQPVQLKH